MKYLLSIAVLVLLFHPVRLSAQSPGSIKTFGLYSVSFILTSRDTVCQLPKEFIAEGSELILLDSTKQLRRVRDYRMDNRFGRILFSPAQLKRLVSDTNLHMMAVTYRVLPINLKRDYALRQVEIRRDSAGGQKIMISQASGGILSDDLFGPGLQKSGSIIRGFSVGSNRDLSLSSGFRMQLAGKLASDVDVTAALTDENSPIQPEGTTQTLREVDKVYVEIKHPQYSAVLGDFNLQIDRKEGGEFGRLNRKLQGAQGAAAFEHISGSRDDVAVSFTGATARGKYMTNQFQGMESVQGPYRLTGANGENHLIIIAGSERVYLNGETMTRGDVNDYTIDYASGEVTFSSRRLITNASRIIIDFEYSDQQFVRNLVAGTVSSRLFHDGLKLNASFMQEADDPDSPIDATLNDTTRGILQQSGANRMKASISGIMKADSGRGQYLIQDTLINGRHYPILVYAPGDLLAYYSAGFSSVDQVPDTSAGYVRIAAGQFRFAGIGQGNYLPLQFLPMPQLHQVFDVNGQISLAPDLTVSGEYAMSSFNQNRFSSQEETTLQGSAFTFTAHYNPKRLIIAGKNIGEVEAHLSDRFVDRRFVPLDRANEVEFNRKWNLSEAAAANEEIQEFSLAYLPTRSVNTAVSYGVLKRPGEVHSTRTQVNIGIADSSLPAVQYQIENINTSDTFIRDESHWTRQRGTLEYEVARWRPGLRIEAEERTAAPSGQDSMRQSSFRIFEIAPHIVSAEFWRMTASAELQIRTEDSAVAGTMNHASQSLTQLYTWQLNGWQSLSSSLTFSVRKVEFTDAFKLRGNNNNDGILVRSQTRFTPLQRAVETDLYYEFSNQRSSRLERIFIRVAKGTGNYKYLGDVNGNGVVDENDFELTRFDGDYIVVYIPSDQVYPVADIKASVRLRLQPARLIPAGSAWLSKALHALSAETYLRVDERSKDPDTKEIYTLNFSHFLNDQTTIAGSQQMTQDVFLFESSSDLSFRFRYNERFGLTQFVSAVERSFQEERSLRIRSQLVQEIGNQTDVVLKKDRLTASSPTSRERDLVSNAVLSDFSYRPTMNWETGFTIGVTQVINYFGGGNATADMNEEGIRMVQSFPGVGQLRAELHREEVLLSNVAHPNAILPYEFTSGKTVGQSFLWQLTFDYRITSNLQVSLNYSGRKEGEDQPIHLAKMEARAFF
jgi:hypothetical protein